MSYPPKVRKAPSNSSSSGSSTSRSRLVSIHGKKEDQMLSSTINSSVGSSTTELKCDISNIEKPPIRKPREREGQEKNANKVVPKAKVLTSEEEAEAAYAAICQKSYLHNLWKQETQRIKSKTEICCSNLEAEIRKSDNEASTVKQLLTESSSLQKCEARIEEIEHVCREGDIYRLQAMLKTINQIMKIENGQVPLTALKVTHASRDNFLSIIQELSNIRNELVSIMKPYEANQKIAAHNLEAIASTLRQLKGLLKDCCLSEATVMSRVFEALSLESCLMVIDQDSPLTQKKV